MELLPGQVSSLVTSREVVGRLIRLLHRNVKQVWELIFRTFQRFSVIQKENWGLEYSGGCVLGSLFCVMKCREFDPSLSLL